MLDIIFMLFSMVVTFIFMIAAHEIGHAYTISRYLKEKVPIKFKGFELIAGNQDQINRLNSQQYTRVLAVGILSGFLPFILLSGLFPTLILFFLLISYFFASMSDMRSMIRNK